MSKTKDNPNLLYAYIKSQQQTIESTKAIGLGNGMIVTDSKEILSILNRQFKSFIIGDNKNGMPTLNKQTIMVFKVAVEAMFGLDRKEEILRRLDDAKAMERDKVLLQVDCLLDLVVIYINFLVVVKQEQDNTCGVREGIPRVNYYFGTKKNYGEYYSF